MDIPTIHNERLRLLKQTPAPSGTSVVQSTTSSALGHTCFLSQISFCAAHSLYTIRDGFLYYFTQKNSRSHSSPDLVGGANHSGQNETKTYLSVGSNAEEAPADDFYELRFLVRMGLLFLGLLSIFSLYLFCLYRKFCHPFFVQTTQTPFYTSTL